MTEKLEKIKTRYEELSHQLADAETISNQELWQKLMKEHSSLEEIYTKYEEYLHLEKETRELQELAENETEAELRELAESEVEENLERLSGLEEELRLLLVPKDPDDDRNVILEIRAGTGGDEAALFGADLFRMYSRYSERHKFSMEVLSSNITGLGGIKEISILVKGKGVFSKLKFESGVHRVQRVPETETGGRIHTSAATVAVLPEAEEVDIQIDPKDIRIDVFHASGHGGQSVNTTDSAVRITHLPTGLIVTCQDEKSQLKNKERAMKVLYSRLYDLEKSQADREYAENRKNQVGSGDRSERIRTYNFPQGRITDHRIGMTIYKIDSFLDGDMDELIDALTAADKESRLKD